MNPPPLTAIGRLVKRLPKACCRRGVCDLRWPLAPKRGRLQQSVLARQARARRRRRPRRLGLDITARRP
eukprot:2862024-Alexandrium_andersonii.AAC.1